MDRIRYAQGDKFNALNELRLLVNQGTGRQRSACGRLISVLESIRLAGFEAAQGYFHTKTKMYRTQNDGYAAFFKVEGPWRGTTEVTLVMIAAYGSRTNKEAIHEEVRRR